MTKFTLNTLAAAVLVATSGAASAAPMSQESLFFSAFNGDPLAPSSLVINLGMTTDQFRADPLSPFTLGGDSLATLQAFMTENVSKLGTTIWTVFGRSNEDANIPGNLEFGGLTTIDTVPTCLVGTATVCSNAGADRINTMHGNVQIFQDLNNPNLQTTDAFFASTPTQRFAPGTAGVDYDMTAGVNEAMAFFSFSPTQTSTQSAIVRQRGQIVPFQNGANPGLWKLSFENDTAALTYSAVPVPAAVWMLGSALVGLAGVGRRKA